MDDVYLINLAKTEFREGSNNGDVDRLTSIFADAFIDLSQGTASTYGADAKVALRKRSEELFTNYKVHLTILVVNIVVVGSLAYDRGFHEFTLTPKAGGEPVRQRERYLEIWSKDATGNWKITVFMNNTDVPEQVGGQISTWFLGDQARPAGN